MTADISKIKAGMENFGKNTSSGAAAGSPDSASPAPSTSAGEQAKQELEATPQAKQEWEAAADALGAREQLELMERQDSVGHREEVYHMRIKFAWISMAIAFSWVAVILIAVLFKSLGRTTPNPLFAAAVTVLGVAMISIPYHCWQSKNAANRIAEEYERFITSESQIRKIRSRRILHRAVMYTTVARASATGAVLFPLAYWYHTAHPFITATRFEMSDALAITLATTTTASVLGILFAVMYWLFPKGYQGEQHQQPPDK